MRVLICSFPSAGVNQSAWEQLVLWEAAWAAACGVPWAAAWARGTQPLGLCLRQLGSFCRLWWWKLQLQRVLQLQSMSLGWGL